MISSSGQRLRADRGRCIGQVAAVVVARTITRRSPSGGSRAGARRPSRSGAAAADALAARGRAGGGREQRRRRARMWRAPSSREREARAACARAMRGADRRAALAVAEQAGQRARRMRSASSRGSTSTPDVGVHELDVAGQRRRDDRHAHRERLVDDVRARPRTRSSSAAASLARYQRAISLRGRVQRDHPVDPALAHAVAHLGSSGPSPTTCSVQPRRCAAQQPQHLDHQHRVLLLGEPARESTCGRVGPRPPNGSRRVGRELLLGVDAGVDHVDPAARRCRSSRSRRRAARLVTENASTRLP